MQRHRIALFVGNRQGDVEIIRRAVARRCRGAAGIGERERARCPFLRKGLDGAVTIRDGPFIGVGVAGQIRGRREVARSIRASEPTLGDRLVAGAEWIGQRELRLEWRAALDRKELGAAASKRYAEPALSRRRAIAIDVVWDGREARAAREITGGRQPRGITRHRPADVATGAIRTNVERAARRTLANLDAIRNHRERARLLTIV